MKTPNDIIEYYYNSLEFNACLWNDEMRLRDTRDMLLRAPMLYSALVDEDRLTKDIENFRRKRAQTVLEKIKEFLELYSHELNRHDSEVPRDNLNGRGKVTIEVNDLRGCDFLIESDRVNFDIDRPMITFGRDTRITKIEKKKEGILDRIKRKYEGEKRGTHYPPQSIVNSNPPFYEDFIKCAKAKYERSFIDSLSDYQVITLGRVEGVSRVKLPVTCGSYADDVRVFLTRLQK